MEGGGGWGMGDGGWGLGPNPQSPIPNPQSPIPISIYIIFPFNFINKIINLLIQYFKYINYFTLYFINNSSAFLFKLGFLERISLTIIFFISSEILSEIITSNAVSSFSIIVSISTLYCI